MGQITIGGNVSGTPYTFNIGGDQPTPEDLQFMQDYISQSEQRFLEQYQQQYGPVTLDTEPGTALGRGLQRGIPQFQSALGSAAGAVGLEGIEDYLKSAATERQLDILRQDPSLLEGADFRKVRGLSSGATYLGELLGEQLPLIGGTVAATGAGVAAGASLPVSAALATVAVSYPQLFGMNIQRQEGQVTAGELADVNVGRAALAAIGQTALEAASNVFLAARIPGGVLRGMLENIPAEALTEIGQQAIERQQAGLPLDSEDAYREYLDAGVAGGALGGLFGAVGGVRGRGAAELPPEPETAPTAEPTPEEVQDVAPTALPDPAAPITAATLDQLGVPKGAPVYKQFPSITTRNEQLAALEDFADKAKDRRVEANIRTYLEQVRAADLAAGAPALSGIGDTGAGAGVRGVVQPGAVSAEGVGAPDAGGLAVLGEPAGAPAGAAAEQRRPLTDEEAFVELAEQAEARRPAPPVPAPVLKQAELALEPTAEAATAPTAKPSDATLKAARAAVREYIKANPAMRATKGDTDKIAERVAQTGRTVDEAAAEILTQAEAAGRTGPRAAPAPEAEPIPGFDEMPEGPDVRGVDPFAEQGVQAQEDITPEQIESRAAAAPEPTPAPAEPEATKRAMPASIPVGPTSLRPKPIGGTLYSDMNLDSLNRLLREVLASSTERGWVAQRWFSNNRDLALGQGTNTGIVVEFDGDLVSGAESRSKPAIAVGAADGTEYRSDYINTDAIRSFTLAPGQTLRGAAARLANQKFDITTADDGSRTFTRKGEPTPAPAEPEIEPEVAIARYDALSEQQKNDLAEAAEIPRAGNQLVAAIVDDPAGYMRLMDMLAEPEPSGLTTAEMAPVDRNVIPGRTTGAAGQVIPEGIAPVPGREPTPRAADPVLTAALNEARMTKSQLERAADAQAAAAIRQKFTETSPELQEYVRQEVDLDPDRDVTSAEDKQKVLALLNQTFTKREKSATNPAWAAHEYFRKHPDVLTALDTIAYDAIAAPNAVTKTTSDMSAGAREYYSQTGRRWGTTAGKWVLANLSREARLQVYERLDFYRPAVNDSLQRSVAAERDKMVERGRQYREYMGDQTGEYVGITPDFETAQELGFGTEDLSGLDALFSPTAALDMPMHPQVVRAFMRGDINAALDGIIATAGSPEAATLAAKLRPFVQNVTLRSFSPTEMADLNEVFGDGRRTPAAGTYVFRYNEAELQAAEPYAPRRIALRRELNGSVILNAETGFTPSTFLHELIHVATIATLDNEAHPLTRQVETLLAKAREIIPASENGVLNRYEFVSEAMTNPAFIQKLAQVDIGLGDAKFTLRQRVVHALRNFLNQLFGRPQKAIGTAKSKLDEMFDDLLAPEPSQRGVGSLYEAAFRPNGYRDAMNSMKDRVVDATPTNMQEVRRLARTSLRALPFSRETKDFLVRASAPLMFVAETAQQYMPSAYQVYETVMGHGAQQHRMSLRVDETLQEIRNWVKNNRDKLDLFNRVRFRATELRMDPRKSRSEYDQFQLTYDVLDSDGDFVERKTLSFPTREARAAVYKRLRDNPQPTRSAPKNTYDPETDENKERLAAFAQLQAEYRQLGPEGQAALNRAFELPNYFRDEMKRVVQKRLDNMFEGQRTMQERIYRNVFEKIFAETLIDPYQALQRRGNFGLSYTARDPDTQDRDPNTGAIIPGTGELKVFKHAFESTQARDQAIRLLERLGPEAEVTQITPYSMDVPGQRQARPSLEFITSVLNTIRERGQLADKNLEKEFLDLVFEATPESSFFRAYQKRRDVPGYDGDVTPIGLQLGVSDTMENIRRNGMHLAARVADTEYQVNLDRLRRDLNEEFKRFEQNSTVTDPIERAANNEEAEMYLRILTDFTNAPFRERANWSRSLTAGGYALTLGFNASTAALTFFQMPTIIYPYLAGKYGPRMSMQSIGIAMRLLTSSGRERTVERVAPTGGLEQVRRKVGWYDFSVSNLDFTDPKNAYLKDLHDIADQAGVFNRSLTQDILDETGAKGWVQKIAAYSGLMQHHTERLMRESTLTSTYLMELHKAVPQARNMPFKSFVKALRDGRISVPAEIGQAAAKEAVYASDMTNGSVLAAAAPLVSQTDVGSVIYLFKRFPLSMLNMLWHTMKRAGTRTNDPVDRRIAAMQFAGMSGSMAMFAGASGIPLFHTVAALYNLLKDDEDEDFETMIRTGVLGERGLTGLVDYYTGLSVSSRIGLSGVFYRPGFNTENQTALATLLEGFGGPIVGLLTKYTDRVPYFFNEGEYWRMTEAAMPTSIGNAMKSFRFFTEGARTLRYDPILDEVGPFAAGAQFLGFMPTEYARQLAQNNYFRKVDNRISEQRTKLLSRRYKAYRLGDTDELRKVMQDIAEYNRRNPQYPITGKSLRDSLRSHRETTSRMHHGVTYSRKNEAKLLRDAEDWGNATAFSR